MFKYFLFIIVFFSGINTSYSQYLGLEDLQNLLDIAEDRLDAEKFLRMNGFDFYDLEYLENEDDEEGDTSEYKIDYIKKLPSDEYFIRVIGDRDEDIYTVMEFSSNEERWVYYMLLIGEAELSPVKTWDREGSKGFEFETSDYMMTLRKDADEDTGEMRYKFFISKY